MRFHRLAAVGLAAGLIVAGCSEEPAPPPSVLTGVIMEITAGAGSEITAFDLDAGEQSYNIRIDPDRDYGFDLNHLYEHERTGDPVRVRLRSEDEALFALQIDDA